MGRLLCADCSGSLVFSSYRMGILIVACHALDIRVSQSQGGQLVSYKDEDRKSSCSF